MLFDKSFNTYDEFTAEILCNKMEISRPTAAELVRNLIERSIICPVYRHADKKKWYKVVQ